MTHPTRLPDTTLSVADAIGRINVGDMTEMCAAVHSMFGLAQAGKLLNLIEAARREVAKEVEP